MSKSAAFFHLLFFFIVYDQASSDLLQILMYLGQGTVGGRRD